MCRDGFHGAPDLQQARRLEFMHQRAPVFGLQRTGRGGQPGGEGVDAGTQGIGAGWVE
ncbi:hypothetical protein D3C87_1953640 [compost metagenome]